MPEAVRAQVFATETPRSGTDSAPSQTDGPPAPPPQENAGKNENAGTEENAGKEVLGGVDEVLGGAVSLDVTYIYI